MPPRLFCVLDCKIYGVVELPRNKSSIQSDQNHLSNWPEYWQLPFNVMKFKTVYFGVHLKLARKRNYDSLLIML